MQTLLFANLSGNISVLTSRYTINTIDKRYENGWFSEYIALL